MKLKEIIRLYPLGLLVILPAHKESLTEAQRENWLLVERLLTEQEYPIPIYFTMGSPTVEEVLGNLKSVSGGDRSASATKGYTNTFIDCIKLFLPFASL